jgi:hypothetical protein
VKKRFQSLFLKFVFKFLNLYGYVMAWLAAPDAAHESGVDNIVETFFTPAATAATAATTAGAAAAETAGEQRPVTTPFTAAAAAAAAAAAGEQSVVKPPGALERFREDLLAGAAVVQRLRRERLGNLSHVVRSEGQVAAALGQLEAVGVGFDAGYVRRGVTALRGRLEALDARAGALLDGEPIMDGWRTEKLWKESGINLVGWLGSLLLF